MAKRDYYEVLGVAKTASDDEIKKAYRKLAMANHPDTHPDDKAAEDRFKEASEAYEILSDKEKRSSYDQFGFAGVDGMNGGAGNYQNVYRDFSDLFGGGGFGDIFGNIFGGGGARTQRSNQGQSLRYDLTIDFKEAIFGTKKDITFTHQEACEACHGEGGTGKKTCPTCHGQGRVNRGSGFFQIMSTCPTCNGSGQIIEDPCKVCHGSGVKRKQEKISVTIPSGVDDGNQIRLRGKGDAGPNGGTPGDLIILISVRDDKYFVREERDIFLQIPISMTQAALGAEIQVPTVDGNDVKVTIPAGFQSGRDLRLKGKGVPKLHGTADAKDRGDMYLRIIVETPKRFSNKAKDLLKELSKTLGEDNSPKPIPFD